MEPIEKIIEEIARTKEPELVEEHQSIATDNSTEKEKHTTEFEGNVPSPFKRLLFWPTPKENVKKASRMKQKVPAVASSEQWQEYHRKKIEKKEADEMEKEAKKKLRQEKAQQKDKDKAEKAKKKIESDKTKSDKKTKKKSVIDDSKREEEKKEEEKVEEKEGEKEEEREDGKNEKITSTSESSQNDIKYNVGDYVIVQYEEDLFPGIVLSIGKC